MYGSRGDIQPGVCLALELQRRGHSVAVLAPPNLVEFARRAGVAEVRELGAETEQAWSSAEATASMKARNPVTRLRFALSNVRRGFAAFDADLRRLFLDSGAPCGDIDVLVAGPLCQDRGVAVAEALGVPIVVLRFAPLSENGVLGPVPGASDGWSPEWKRRSWRAADRVTWWATGWNEQSFRTRIGLPRASGPLPRRLREAGVPQLQAYDEALIPGLAADWGEHKPIVGFLDLPPDSRTRLPETTPADAALADWLAAGEPPVFVSFGSMPLTDPEAVIGIVRTACRRAGHRVLFAIGERRGPDPHDPGVYFVGPTDHSALLPRCAAAIHHGGAGTTAATLRAGLPTLICSITADQPFWGQRVRAVGAGGTRRLRTLTADEVRVELGTLFAPATRAAAADLAAALVPAEKAAARAAELVEQQLR
ncbi:glycosyltransferase [Nocardia sp. NPDC057353]|uniref:glycosyltransferase n=1 Tax=Nocardia sp. NPDC057353 TaxID=3346104 RepID=UPI0036352499